MKILIDRKVFAQALSEVAPFAPSKPTIAILKNAKITTKDTWMKIEANDSQNSMVKYIPMMECDQDGTFLIEIADINKFVAKVKGDTIELDIDGNTVRMKHSKGTAEFQTQNADEFPAFKMPDVESTEISLPTSLLADVIAKGKNFVATEVIRPVMTGIYAYVKNGLFGYCASDTHKLIHGHQPCAVEISSPNVTTDDIHWLIMPAVFSALLTACKGADTAKIQITESNVQYTIGGTRIQTVQAKGQYPNFERVIPQNWNMECAVDKADIVDALGRVAQFCDDSECVKFDINRMDMMLSVDNLDYMKSAKEDLTHGGCNGDIKIGVNVNHVLTSIGAFNQGEILMRMTDASRPIVFAQRENENVTTLSMPMTLVNE